MEKIRWEIHDEQVMIFTKKSIIQRQKVERVQDTYYS
jgi:hypothetical protein